jgi:hypothetical protein
LSKPRTINSASKNESGWARPDGTGASLNKYLQSRIYKAINLQQRQLIKEANVVSSVGKNSFDTSSSYSYLFVPAAGELMNLESQTPYNLEGTPISIFSNYDSRICTTTNGVAVKYWTRSPYIHTSTDNYWNTIANDGSLSSYNQATTSEIYVRPMFTI